MEERRSSERLARLVESSRSLWAGEAWVFAAYWDCPARTRRTDLAWLARQCHKELVDGMLLRAGWLAEALDRCDPIPALGSSDATERLIGELAEEYSHLRAFATAHEQLRGPADPPLTFHDVRTRWGWPENDGLVRLRARHRAVHGELGLWATLITEGGGATLYRSGAARRGCGPADDVIAEACEAVARDETAHVGTALQALRSAPLDDDAWDLLTRITVEQLRQRIRMRNAQFGRPLGDRDLGSALAGRAPDPGHVLPPGWLEP